MQERLLGQKITFLLQMKLLHDKDTNLLQMVFGSVIVKVSGCMNFHFNLNR